jgi:FKBP-type peptidyl-prolyl cis-trans isomerase FkpA
MRFKYLLFLSILMVACSKSPEGFVERDGLLINMHKNAEGKPITVGEYAKFNMSYSINDSILFNTYKNGDTANIRIQEPVFEGDLFQAFLILSKGDSATFIVPAKANYQTFFNSKPPSFIKDTDQLLVTVKLEGVLNAEQMTVELGRISELNRMKEDEYIQEFIDSSPYSFVNLNNGLKIYMEHKGGGDTIFPGMKLKAHTIGKYLNGDVFYSSLDSGEPIDFFFGNGEVIRGIEEGINGKTIGSIVHLVIPSYLAYGHTGKGKIAPYTPLYFKLEILADVH